MKYLKPLAVFVALLLLPVFTAPCAAAEGPALPGSIYTQTAAQECIAITVSIFQEGKLVNTMDYATRFGGNPLYGEDTFQKLPPGIYEVRFESPGYVTINRQTIIREGNLAARVLVFMQKGQGATTFGVGPSIQELEARIKKLEDARK